jgi:tRNA pseudouridine55 synthase
MDGLILIDKPAGPSSHDVVAEVKRALKEKKVGHAGTLDPQATGLLVLALGSATRWLPYLPGDKRYQATLKLGLETDTEDIWGKELKRSDASGVSDEALAKALLALKDSKEQRPPMVSALKHQGKPLYAWARQGVDVERAARPMEIFEIKLGLRRGDEMDFEVHAGSGTYVRSLCREAGQVLGVGACMAALRRTQVGAFDIKNAVPPAQASAACVLGAEQALGHLKSYAVPDSDLSALGRGQGLAFEDGSWDESETWRMTGSGGELLALGSPKRLGSAWRMQPKRVFSKA